ncbi:hypothetical protein G6F44_012685 [Rhizopus delemar]|nr:hypothetical protein G6F44_012685 [Rhizopus delemar]
MDSPPDFILVDDFIAGLFHYASSWNDVKSLLLVCQQFNFVGQKQTIDLPLQINADFAFEKFSSYSAMAKVVHFNCDISTKEAVFGDIINYFTNCFVVGVNFNDLSNLTTIKKICATVLKKGITLNILHSFNAEVADIVRMLTEKYHEQHRVYEMKQNSSNVIKRKRSEDDLIVLRVPKDLRLRQKFLLNYVLNMSDPPSNNNVPNPFASISHITVYTDTISVSKFFTCGFDEAYSQIRQFVNCIIKFDGFTLLVNSFDVFYHNHRYYDDCAQYLNRIDQIATARVSRKTYTNKQFTEVSIFAGHYELLIIGGYLCKSGSITPFLGSSMNKYNLLEDSTTSISVPAVQSGFIKTSRQLNQYFKRHSHQLWSFHCARSYTKGFYPISPIELMDHASQKFRKPNNHHFASAVLYLITSPKPIKENDMESLWSLFVLSPFFESKLKSLGTKPENFADMSSDLKKDNDVSHMGSLIHILGSLHMNTPCYFLSLYKEVDAKHMALKIMTSGLKQEIASQQQAIIKKAKEEL